MTQCAAHTKTGRPCTQKALLGTVPPRCRMHGGGQQHGRELRSLVTDWRLDTTRTDPAEVMLRAVTVAWYRFMQVSEELDSACAELGIARAVVGQSVSITKDGDVIVTGEYVRALVKAEMDWLDRAQKASAACVGAGLAERQVRLAERQGHLIVEVVRATLAEFGVSIDADAVAGSVRRNILSLAQ